VEKKQLTIPRWILMSIEEGQVDKFVRDKFRQELGIEPLKLEIEKPEFSAFSIITATRWVEIN
jgi:hypothetical protein